MIATLQLFPCPRPNPSKLVICLLLASVLSAIPLQVNAQDPAPKVPVTVGLEARSTPQGMKDALEPDGYTGIAVYNNMRRPVCVTIRTTDGKEVGTLGPIPVSWVCDKGRQYSGVSTRIRLPAGPYTATVTMEGYDSNTVNVPGLSTRLHQVGIGDATKACSPVPGDWKAEFRTGDCPAAQRPMQQSAIGSRIDQIAGGPHQELPQPAQSAIATNQNPGWLVENATGYQLHLYSSGPTEREYTIQNGSSIDINLPAGSYRVAADVSDKSVLPFYAVRQLSAGTRWKSHFYLAPQ